MPRGTLLALAGLLVSVPTGAATTTFINELHYDNGGGDIGEGVEVAGAAGTDLDGWRVVLYNGSSGATYGDTVLSGVIPDLAMGYGTLFMPLPGIQNGSPDGLALVDDNGAVVQFLSYEGSFTAVDGAAIGLSSLNIGVEEPSDGPAGLSLQLAGSGRTYEDFHWMAPAVGTYGAINNGQQFAPVPLPASLPLLLGAFGALAALRRSQTRRRDC